MGRLKKGTALKKEVQLGRIYMGMEMSIPMMWVDETYHVLNICRCVSHLWQSELTRSSHSPRTARHHALKKLCVSLWLVIYGCHGNSRSGSSKSWEFVLDSMIFHINLAAVMGTEPKTFVEVFQQGQWPLSVKGTASIWRKISEPQNVKEFHGDSWS